MRVKVATPIRIERRGSDDRLWPNNTAFHRARVRRVQTSA